MTISTRVAIAVVCMALGVGCTLQARPSEMIPDQVDVAHRHPVSVMLDTVGYKGDIFFNPTLINSDDFAVALERAIVQSGVFATVVRSSQADYLLYVEALQGTPPLGRDITVHVRGTWRLTNVRTGKVVFDEFLSASARKTVADEFSGNKRYRIAIEAAVQAFIRDGLQRLSRLDLP